MAKKTTTEANLFTPEEFKKNFKVNKKTKKEESTQMAVCKHLKDEYPDVIFTCDLASGMKLPIWIAAKNKAMRSSRGLPDLFIAHPKTIYSEPSKGPGPTRLIKEYNGLFVELKRDGESPYLKNGSLSSDKHVQEQAAILKRLESQGYKAVFATGTKEAIEIIDEYLS